MKVRNVPLIDLDRLHAVVMGELNERQCGRTTAMLVEAAQQSDFLPVGSEVTIVAENDREVEHLAALLRRVAVSLNMVVARRRRDRVDIQMVCYRVVSQHALTRPVRGPAFCDVAE